MVEATAQIRLLGSTVPGKASLRVAVVRLIFGLPLMAVLLSCTVSRAANPTVGAHALAYFPSPAGYTPNLVTPARATQESGSTMLVWVGRQNAERFTSPMAPTDNYSNSFALLGDVLSYAPKWPYSGETLYAASSAVGGVGHVVSIPMPAFEENTLVMVEVKHGGVIQDVKWNVVLAPPNTSLSVTTTQPATLVAVWAGDGSVANSAVPDNGFTTVEELFSPGYPYIQVAVATRDVTEAGTYSVTWTASPGQGAHMWLVAVQSAPPALPTLTITAENQSKVYGQTNPPLTVSYSGFVNGEGPADLDVAVTLTTSATTNSPVGTYPITASGASDTNYTISYVAGTLTVQPAALEITAENQSRVYGQANPPLTANYSGFVNGEGPAVLDVPVTLATPATTNSPVGTYPITASGASATNYAISYVAGILTVEPNAEFTDIALDAEGQVHLRFTGLAGRLYQVQFSSDLKAWQPVASIQCDLDGIGSYIGYPVQTNEPAGFYRIAWP